jgi:hypothetical protein
MRQVTGMSYRYCLAAAVAATLASVLSACSGSTATTGTSSAVSCTNYAIHASGRYHEEVWVRVSVSNATTAPRRYAVEVALSVRGSQPGAAAPKVTVNGLVAANSSAELGRKVLTTDTVQRCRVIRLSRS